MIEREEEVGKREEYLMNLISEIDYINHELARLKVAKEELEKDLIAAIGHSHEGSKTYNIRDKSITIKTDIIYALDKNAYISGDYYLPPEFDPVLQKVTYEVNKSLFKSYYNHSPAAVRDTLDKLIERKESKANVKIQVKL